MGPPATPVNDEVKVKVCSGHTRPICHINYSNEIDGTYWFVTSCHDSKPMLRNGQTGDWVGTFEGHMGAVFCSSFNAEATRVVTGSGDYTAAVWDAIKGNRLHVWEHSHYIKSCDWFNNKIVTGCYDCKIRVFDAINHDATPITLLAGDKSAIKAVYFVESDHIVVTACEDAITKWDLRTAQTVQKHKVSGLNVLEYVHSNDIVAAHGTSITTLDPRTLSEKRTFQTAEDVECASLAPDGERIAAGSKIKVKEFAIDGTEVETHRGHHGPVFHVRWSPDGKSFASGAEDGMVRIWPSHQIIQKYEGSGES